jgi:hypothetical protein
VTVPAWPVCRRCLFRRGALLLLASVLLALAAATALAPGVRTLAPGIRFLDPGIRFLDPLTDLGAIAPLAGVAAALWLMELASWRRILNAELSPNRTHVVLHRPSPRYAPLGQHPVQTPVPEVPMPVAPVPPVQVVPTPAVDLRWAPTGTAPVTLPAAGN